MSELHKSPRGYGHGFTPSSSPPEQEEVVIDPNLYGPFGHRYHESSIALGQHIQVDPTVTGWHEVETTEQHLQHADNARVDTVIPALPYASDSSTSALVANSAPMTVIYSQDSKYTYQTDKVSRASTNLTHLRRRSKPVNNHSHSASLFDLVHGRDGTRASDKPHVETHGDDVPITFRHLIKRPVIRQWLHGNKLFREKEERKPSQFELVFDLIFVAVVNKLGHATAESSSAINALKFVLSFWPCFSIWTDVRLFLNTSGTDDILERLLLLGWMILLGGYMANVSAVEFVKATPELLAAFHNEQIEGDAPNQLEGHTIADELKSIFRRAASAEASHEAVKLAAPAFNGYWLVDGYDRAIHAGIGFFLVAKLWRLGIYIYYGFCLPKFRRALWLNALALTVVAAIYVPITLTTDPLYILILLCSGILVELIRPYITAAAIQLFHGRQKRTGNHMFIPAQSHEHSIERYVLFVILIVGESIISSNFTAAPGHYGINDEFGRAALGISISVLVIWIYYDADGSRVFQHALRRNSFTSITFSHIHYPLTAALVLMATSLSSLISHQRLKGGYLWYFGCSTSCVMLCLGLIGCMHRNLDVHGSTLIPRSVRIGARFVVAIEFALLPLKKDWLSLEVMSVVTGSLLFLVLFETLGKIGAVGRRYDSEKRKELYSGIATSGQKALKLDKRGSWHPFDDLTAGEKGEEDVGIESEIGHLEEKDLAYGQRWAYAA